MSFGVFKLLLVITLLELIVLGVNGGNIDDMYHQFYRHLREYDYMKEGDQPYVPVPTNSPYDFVTSTSAEATTLYTPPYSKLGFGPNQRKKSEEVSKELPALPASRNIQESSSFASGPCVCSCLFD